MQKERHVRRICETSRPSTKTVRTLRLLSSCVAVISGTTPGALTLHGRSGAFGAFQLKTAPHRSVQEEAAKRIILHMPCLTKSPQSLTGP